MPTIPRALPSASLSEWTEKKPHLHMAQGHMERVIKCAPAGWQEALRGRLVGDVPPIVAAVKTDREWMA